MTEAEWFGTDDPELMVHFVRDPKGDRKLRLYACACSRRLWSYFEDERTRTAVEMGEAFADGLVSNAVRREATVTAHQVATNSVRVSAAGANCANRTGHQAATAINSMLKFHTSLAGERFPETSRLVRANLLRDLFGNPFRPVAFSPSWRTSAAVALGAQMYASRDFGAMPILGDALQDAGCDHADVLDHCRSEDPHARGCWVVDLVLGRE